MMRILHPSDFSPDSETAFLHALRLALVDASSLTVLHVDPPATGSRWEAFPRTRETLERWQMLPPGSPPEALDAFGVEVRKIQALGSDPVLAILRYLLDDPMDLLVLATRGRDGLARWWRGSVAEPVARVSQTMSLFIPHGCRPFVSADTGALSLRRVLVPCDQRPSPELALKAARSLVRAVGATDVVITACHVGAEAAALDIDVGDAERMVRRGPVATELLAAAAETEADLIVMTTLGHEGVLDVFRGSTTEQVLRRAPCPVLAVPAKGAPRVWE